ncbi:MAG: helix-hairpin-helix domain-containing protein [Oscillospiraceae bacterium]|nr:helix-hairpin-helix domain-containing protein [Oscillospiraceae bacterium]
MKLKKAETVIVALTIAFVFFTGGYFIGRRGSVNIVTVYPEERRAAVAQSAYLPTDISIAETSATNSQEVPAYPTGTDTQIQEPAPEEIELPQYEDELQDELPDGDEPEEEVGETIGAPRGGDHRIININTASRTELTDLHGIGPALAGRIVDHRERYGPFNRIEDIMNVSGIGPGRFGDIRDRITVGAD